VATRPVYSVSLFSAFPVTAGVSLIGGPDSTHSWVIRDIVATNTQSWFGTAAPIILTDSSGATLFAVQAPDAFNGRVYHWEGRQVIEYPDTVSVNAGDGSWSLRISGYDLTLP
jgi:hypothetical protein